MSTESKSSKKEKTKKKKSDNKNTGKTSKVEISQSSLNKEYPFEVRKLTKKMPEKKHQGDNLIKYLKFKFCEEKRKKTILDEISFKVSNGECYCILGANGSGKTTSFKCFSKEIEPEKGNIIVGGINIKDFTQEQPSIGYCPQFDCVFEYLTAKENLMFYAKLKGIREISLEKIVDVLLEKLNLKDDPKIMAHQLSGGNKRKLSVGISILSRPMVILMDEPSTGMDPYSRQLLLDLLHKAYLKPGRRKKNAKKRALVLVTHLIQEAGLISDRIGILQKGKIRKNKKIIDLLKNESSDIILSIEYKEPSKESLKIEFGNILSDKVKKEEINKVLSEINRKNYEDYFAAKKFGNDIYKGIKKRGWIRKSSIFRLVKYLDYTLLLTKKLKKYFFSVNCINYVLNNFVFKIKKDTNDDKCDSRIYGILETCKDECHIDEYNYNITTLESIFLETIGDKNDLVKSQLEKLNITL